MKILSSQQIREADQYTIKHEPISSIDLMERASNAFVNKFLGLHPEKKLVYIFCGTGNNGGDGLSIGRLLTGRGWKVHVYIVGDPEKGTDDFKINLERLKSFESIGRIDDFPNIPSNSIVIDALFGSGLSRPIEGLFGALIKFLNEQNAQRIAVDISSGLFADSPLSDNGAVFEADYSISFQLPKLIFFLPDYEKYVGQWRVVDIGLMKNFIQNQKTNFYLSQAKEIKKLIPVRSTFAHKNQVGRLMIVAGSKGKMGAAVLCTRAAFRSGAGLVNVHVPCCGVDILQISIPEAMVSYDEGEAYIESIPKTTDTIAIGPGLGISKETVEALRVFLKSQNKPLVIDADGINILANNLELINMLPKESILTPHPGELKRLIGEWENDFDKLDKLRAFCIKNEFNVVLKGAFSATCNSHGVIYFNPTGNPGLATAGSGDALTGMIGALLAQGLSPFDALQLAVYLHGSAGDEATRELQTPWIQASDIIDFIPQAIGSLLNN
ncbi:NAD(P)H-hydrate dehydratase [Ekhidna sp.]|uniref:NAD(P)H-hydrate dehydratase n=1 Tax=Ekhidna sp. TaxID=2608089 RepID=UPI003297DAF5